MIVEDYTLKYMIEDWKHVFKLDPAKEISDDHLEQLCDSGTDAVIIGGTDNITLNNILELMYRVRRYAVTCVLEISSSEGISPGFDYYFVPMVLNSTEKKRSEEHTSELQSRGHLVCRLLLQTKKSRSLASDTLA